VSLVIKLYQRFRMLIHEGSKFLVVGGFGFLVTEAVFNLMLAQHQASFTANVVSTLVAAAVTFVGNRYWTFRHRERTSMGRETIIFFVLNGVGVFIQQACIEFAKDVVGKNDKLTLNIAFLVGVGLATLFRFWSYRKFVWQALPGGPVPPAAQEPAAAPSGTGHEQRQPALVPPDPLAGPGSPNGNGAAPHRAGHGPPDDPWHARSR
jgi:putative flippase GtrA